MWKLSEFLRELSSTWTCFWRINGFDVVCNVRKATRLLINVYWKYLLKRNRRTFLRGAEYFEIFIPENPFLTTTVKGKLSCIFTRKSSRQEKLERMKKSKVSLQIAVKLCSWVGISTHPTSTLRKLLNPWNFHGFSAALKMKSSVNLLWYFKTWIASFYLTNPFPHVA